MRWEWGSNSSHCRPSQAGASVSAFLKRVKKRGEAKVEPAEGSPVIKRKHGSKLKPDGAANFNALVPVIIAGAPAFRAAKNTETAPLSERPVSVLAHVCPTFRIRTPPE